MTNGAKLLTIHCADKKSHHEDKVNPKFQPFHPSKLCLAASSGSGKGSLAKNIICRAQPPFERIYIVHYDVDEDGKCGSEEWDDMEPEKYFNMNTFPENPTFFDRDVKNCVIFDEINCIGLSRSQRAILDRFFSYTCSHQSVTALFLQQNFTSIPVSIRRACQYITLWKGVDKTAERHLTATTGHDMKELFKLCKKRYDSITLDFIGEHAPLRLNFYAKVEDDEAC